MRGPHDLEAGVRWRAVSVTGDGRFALLSRCGAATVSLHPDLEAATAACDALHERGCGPACSGSHAVYDLDEGRDAGPVHVTPPERPRNAPPGAPPTSWGQ